MEEEKLPLYKWISRIRKVEGMTQRELAKRIGVTPQAVGLWEKAPHRGGTEPRRARLTQIEDILGAKYHEYSGDLRHTSGDNDKETEYRVTLKHRTGDLLERRLMLIEDILHADEIVIATLESLIERVK